MLAPTPLWDPSLGQSRDQATARRLAWLLGCCLPLSGGLSLGTWIPGYPGQITVIRVVTVVALLWLATHPVRAQLPMAPRLMLQAFALAMAYGAVSVLWAPSLRHGMHDLAAIGLALSTAVAVVLLVREDLRTLRAFALGLLISGGLQVIVAAWEVATGQHLTSDFGAEKVAQWNLVSIEQAIGRVAWGSLGNPNDLAGYLLLTTAVFLSMGAYGIALRRPARLLGWGLLALSVAIALTSMADARAYRLGLAVVVAMHLLDFAWTPGRTPYRRPFVLLVVGIGVVLAVSMSGTVIQAISSTGQSVSLRLELISEGFSTALNSGGLGRGLGTEQSLIDTGEIPLNFHNVVVQLAAELGLVVAVAFVAYLVWLVICWAFVTRSARELGRKAAIAQATLASALLFYGATSSGVLESPDYWAFLAVTAVLAGVPRDSIRTMGSDGTAFSVPRTLIGVWPKCKS